MTFFYNTLPPGWENYPKYNEKIGGWICSGCGVVTPINYDDVGITYRVAPLCQECREKWDKACESIPRIYIENEEPPEKVLNSKDDLLFLLNLYRDENLLPPLKIDQECQDLANYFIKKKIYSTSIDRTYSNTANALNELFKDDKWKAQNILVAFIRFPKKYNSIAEIFDREIVRSLFNSDDWGVIGITKNEIGVAVVMRSQKLASSGIES